MAAVLDITYDLNAYAHLEATAEKPELYLNRYFTRHFYGKYPPIYNLRLCTVGIAREHPLFGSKDSDSSENPHGSIVKIEFAPAIKSCVIQGKNKKQSMRVGPDTKLCTVFMSSGKEFIVRAAVRGLLMEWNQRLEDEPQMLTDAKYLEHAFVAIIKPPTDDDAKILSDCVSAI
ncbi:hypothetical protein GGI21_002668 [Coemansia aciculifera]|nr:hypothetical protein GGI21_002668 [Coemansia aciculifera]